MVVEASWQWWRWKTGEQGEGGGEVGALLPLETGGEGGSEHVRNN